MIKKISILGSTGSIGLTTLGIISKKKNLFKVILLSGNKNFNLICKQIKKYNPKYFLIKDPNTFERVKKRFKKKKIKIINNVNLKDVKIKSDVTIAAIPGVDGLNPTINIIKLTKKILIANKESIICGWDLIKKKAKKYKTKIGPIDSEHFSILELIKGHKVNEIEKIFITASGGPFLNLKNSKFKNIKPRDALHHPKWKMGKKITVDSATLMNKMLELIEAHKLFEFPLNKLEILIHPNSLVHAIVKFKNGITKFIYHDTTMIIPLANSIFDNKIDIKNFYKKNKKLMPDEFNNFIFEEPNKKKFPIIKILKRINEYPSTPIIINSANEVLVEHFLKKNMPFLDISNNIMTILNDRNYRKYAIRKPSSLKQILNIDNWARKTVIKKLKINEK